ncbi:gene transfer agent family protein [Agrobacterium tumefaciens]|jgi:hypothetical protein|uniref:gene transfer agent family protein n=1 Tax=Agrobacterium tumefaciens TaxID=358 RepID=UPI0009765E89|nr:hypothetical protein BV900_02375 [Agrobacterium tumefaciens]
MIEYRTFFGDGEKVFAFPTPELIKELEEKTGHGVGALLSRLQDERFAFMDLLQIIRLGLIGGGTTPREADRLVSIYGVGRPWRESYFIALGIMNAVFYGNTEDNTQGDIGQTAATGDMSAAINEALKQVAE